MQPFSFLLFPSPPLSPLTSPTASAAPVYSAPRTAEERGGGDFPVTSTKLSFQTEYSLRQKKQISEITS